MLKNYTSSVPLDRTVMRIEAALAKAGATGIIKDYEKGALVAICFKVRLPTGKDVAIRLPANEEAVFQTLRKSVKRPRKHTFDNLRDQARRTAWKLIQDWVEVQLSLIQMQQSDFMQVFLPYVWDGRRTFYEALKEQNFLALPAPKE